MQFLSRSHFISTLSRCRRENLRPLLSELGESCAIKLRVAATKKDGSTAELGTFAVVMDPPPRQRLLHHHQGVMARGPRSQVQKTAGGLHNRRAFLVDARVDTA